MSMTTAGLVCDICGDYFLTEILLDKTVQGFSIKGIAKTLHGHDKCCAALKAAGRDWEKIPEGPLRKSFEKAVKDLDVKPQP